MFTFIFYFGYSFAVQPEYCSENRVLRAKNLTFHAGWDDGIGGLPDFYLNLSTCKTNSGLTREKNCSSFWLVPVQENNRDYFEAGTNTRQSNTYERFNTNFYLQIDIRDEEYILYQQISLQYYSMNLNSYLRATESYVHYSVVGVQYEWNLDFYIYVQCDLKECSSRAPLETGCRSSLDTTPCYQQMENGTSTNVCRLDCLSDHTIGDSTSGRCKLKDCNQRVYNASASYPCGSSDCFFDSTAHRVAGEQCIKQCGTNHLLTGVSSSGVCILKNCEIRTMNESSVYPCGESDCFQQMENGTLTDACGLDCPSAHTIGNSTTGRCVLKNCSDRVYNASASYPCGEATCFQQMENGSATNTCKPDCFADHYIGDSTTGRCVLKDCNQRVFNPETLYPCGDGNCYQRFYINPFLFLPSDYVPAAGNICGTDCVFGNHQIADRVTGRCVLKDCDQRMYTTSAYYPCGEAQCRQQYYPCGEANCYQQMENGSATNACRSDCPPDHTVADNTTGLCVLKDCDQRVYNASASYPCGEANCYLQMENGITTNACGAECVSSNNTFADDTTGRCVFKDCAQRVYDASASFPCGESNCYQQMENGEASDACRPDCPSDHTVADHQTGRCIIYNKDSEYNKDSIYNKDSGKTRGGSNTVVVVLSIVIPVTVLVVIVLFAAGLLYSRKKKKTEKNANNVLVDMISQNPDSVNENTVDPKGNILLPEEKGKCDERRTVKMKMAWPAECEFTGEDARGGKKGEEDYPRMPEHPLLPTCSTLPEYPLAPPDSDPTF